MCRPTWARIPALRLATCGTQHKLLSLSDAQCLLCQVEVILPNAEEDCCENTEVKCVSSLAERLAGSKRSMALRVLIVYPGLSVEA